MSLQELREKRARMLTEVAGLGDGAGDRERRGNLARGVQKIDQEISQIELQRVRAAIERGDTVDGDGVPGAGIAHLDPARPGSRPALGGDVDGNRSAALRTIERHTDILTAPQADHLERVVRKDRFGVDAAYLAKIGTDDYAAGFLGISSRTRRPPVSGCRPASSARCRRRSRSAGCRPVSAAASRLPASGSARRAEAFPCLSLWIRR